MDNTFINVVDSEAELMDGFDFPGLFVFVVTCVV